MLYVINEAIIWANNGQWWAMANVVLNFNQGFGSNISGHCTFVHNWNLKLPHVSRDGQTRNGTLMKHVKVSDFCVMSHFNLGKEIVIAICSWSSPHTPTQAGACNKDTPHPQSPVTDCVQTPSALCPVTHSETTSALLVFVHCTKPTQGLVCIYMVGSRSMGNWTNWCL